MKKTLIILIKNEREREKRDRNNKGIREGRKTDGTHVMASMASRAPK